VQSVKRGDEQVSLKKEKIALNKISEQRILGRMMAKKTEDPRKSEEMRLHSNTLENSEPKLIAKTKVALSDPKQEQPFLRVVTDSKDSSGALSTLALESIKDRERRKREEEERRRREEEEKRRLEEERRRREEEERRLAEEKLGKNTDEVFLASQAVTERVRAVKERLGKDFPDYTTEGKLYDAAREVGRLMALLSDAARRGARSEIIKYSREIANVCKNFYNLAAEQAATCTDPKLKEELLLPAQQAQQMSVQLKIIAAVKATMESESVKSTKWQLVKCAKSLAGSVVKTVDSSEVAAIRSKKH